MSMHSLMTNPSTRKDWINPHAIWFDSPESSTGDTVPEGLVPHPDWANVTTARRHSVSRGTRSLIGLATQVHLGPSAYGVDNLWFGLITTR